MSNSGKSDSAEPPALTADERAAADALERFRQTGIRLDREGRFWHEGGQVEHPGLYRAFLRWLDVLDDGRSVLRLDDKRYAYLDVDDAHLLVVAARWEGERVLVATNDGVEQELDYESLAVGAADALYCRARGGRLVARVTTPAYYVIAEGIEPVDGGDSHFALRAAGSTFPIATR